MKAQSNTSNGSPVWNSGCNNSIPRQQKSPSAHQTKMIPFTSASENMELGGKDATYKQVVGIKENIVVNVKGCPTLIDLVVVDMPGDVRHVPNIRLNLLSVGKLDDIRHGSYFGDAKWKLTKGSLIVARESK
jgi:hypothetical protein